MRWRAIQVLIVVSSGCAPSPAAHLAFSLPTPLAAADCLISSEATPPALTASLRVGGGYPDCPMAIAADLSVSGTCEDIQVGIVRPLMMIYASEPDASAKSYVAFHVGFVDLRPENIASGSTSVSTILDKDPGTSEIVYYSAQILAMPQEQVEVSSLRDEARQWARAEIEAIERSGDPDSLDRDNDRCPNLIEACKVELFDTTKTLACDGEFP